MASTLNRQGPLLWEGPYFSGGENKCCKIFFTSRELTSDILHKDGQGAVTFFRNLLKLVEDDMGLDGYHLQIRPTYTAQQGGDEKKRLLGRDGLPKDPSGPLLEAASWAGFHGFMVSDASRTTQPPDVQPEDCISCALDLPLSQEDASGKTIGDGTFTPRALLLEEKSGVRVWIDAQCRPLYVVTPVRHVRRMAELDDEELVGFVQGALQYARRVHGVHRAQPGDSLGSSGSGAGGNDVAKSGTNDKAENLGFESLRVNHGSYQNLSHLHLKVWVDAETFEKNEAWRKSSKGGEVASNVKT